MILFDLQTSPENTAGTCQRSTETPLSSVTLATIPTRWVEIRLNTQRHHPVAGMFKHVQKILPQSSTYTTQFFFSRTNFLCANSVAVSSPALNMSIVGNPFLPGYAWMFSIQKTKFKNMHDHSMPQSGDTRSKLVYLFVNPIHYSCKML